MDTVWKYELDITDRQDVKMPSGARILSVQMQGGKLCLWAMVDPDSSPVVRSILIVGTGNPFNGRGVRFIGTVQQGPLVWHVFEE